MRMRCLYALSTVAAVVVLGVGTGQFANPLTVRDVDQVMLPVLAGYLICLAVPVALYNLTFVKDSDASWLLKTAPAEPTEGVTFGACKAVQTLVVTPACLVLALVGVWVWKDPAAAALHAALAWGLSWLAALASLCWAMPAPPFSRSPSRGGSIGPIAIPLAGFSSVAMLMAGAHLAWAGGIWFWVISALGCTAGAVLLRPMAARRARSSWRENA